MSECVVSNMGVKTPEPAREPSANQELLPAQSLQASHNGPEQ